MKGHRVLVAFGGILFIYNVLILSVVAISAADNVNEVADTVQYGLGTGFLALLDGWAIVQKK